MSPENPFSQSEPAKVTLPATKPAGCSLASFFLLAVVFAIVMAGVRMTLADPNRLSDTLIAVVSLFGAAIGAVIGVAVAAARGLGWLSVLAGFLGGAGFGALAGMLVATPRNLLVVGAGWIVLTLYSLWIRWHAPRE